MKRFYWKFHFFTGLFQTVCYFQSITSDYSQYKALPVYLMYFWIKIIFTSYLFNLKFIRCKNFKIRCAETMIRCINTSNKVKEQWKRVNIQWNIEIKLKKKKFQYFLESRDQILKIRCKNTIIGCSDSKIRCGDSYLLHF